MTAYTAIQSLRCDKVTDADLTKRKGLKIIGNWFDFGLILMIFALKSEQFRSKFDSLSSKIFKIPGFNLIMDPYHVTFKRDFLGSAVFFPNFYEKVDNIYNFEEVSVFIKYFIANHVSTNVFFIFKASDLFIKARKIFQKSSEILFCKL